VRILCRALEVHPGGYYAWLSQPLSERDIEDKRLTGQIKQYWLESVGILGTVIFMKTYWRQRSIVAGIGY